MLPLRRHRLGFAAVTAVALMAFASPPATANIILDTSIVALGQGFGADPRLLTVMIPSSGVESGCVGNSSGSAVIGSAGCDTHDATFQPNGLINTGGNEDTSGPMGGNKDQLAVLANVAGGITNASQIILVYNPSQTGNAPQTDIQDITLKFYNASNNEVISVDGGCGSSCTGTASDSLFFGNTGVNLGNGGVGFTLVLDATEAAAVNAACGVNFANCVT